MEGRHHALSEYLPEWTGRSQDSEELLGDKGREENSLEKKIEFIAKRLLSYEETFASIVNALKPALVVLILIAVYYGWKLLAGLF